MPLKILKLTPKVRNLKIIIFNTESYHRNSRMLADQQAQTGEVGAWEEATGRRRQMPPLLLWSLKQVVFPSSCTCRLLSFQLLRIQNNCWRLAGRTPSRGVLALTWFRNKFQWHISQSGWAGLFNLFWAMNLCNRLGSLRTIFQNIF